MTRPNIIGFVPLKNRKEYRDNILGISQTPGEGWRKGRGKEGGREGSAANRGVLVQTIFRPLNRHGDLATIHSEDGESFTGSQSMSFDREEGMSTMQGWSDAGSVRKMTSFMSDGARNQEHTTLEGLKETERSATVQQNDTRAMMNVAVGRRRTGGPDLRPNTTVGITGRRMAPVEVKHSTGAFDTIERPVTITQSLAQKILKSRVDVVNLM